MHDRARVEGDIELNDLPSPVEQDRLRVARDNEDVHRRKHVAKADAATGTPEAVRNRDLGIPLPADDVLHLVFAQTLHLSYHSENGTESCTALTCSLDETGNTHVVVHGVLPAGLVSKRPT